VTLCKERTHWEFLNDRDQWISGFLMVLRDRAQKAELLRRLRYSAWETADFNRCCKTIKGELPAPVAPVERACVFLVNNQQSYNKSGRTHSICDTNSGIPKWKRIHEHIEFMAARIRDCAVLCKDYGEALHMPEVDDPRMLVYADPPYLDVEKTFYSVNKREGFDHRAFRESLDRCQASLLVSYERDPNGEVLDLYKPGDGWRVDDKRVTRSLGNKGKEATELLFIRMSDWARERAPRWRIKRVRDMFDDE